MYKRRDWIFTHNPDTGAISSDSGSGDSDDDDGGSQGAASGEDSEGDVAAELDADAVSEDEEEPQKSMEHLQGMLEGSDDEEDEEAGGQRTLGADRNRSQPSGGGKGIDPEALEDQKMAWLQAEGSERPKGIPLRCLLCKDKLLVSSDVFRQHLTSKTHMASAKRHGISDDQLKQLDSIVAASSVRVKASEGTETHTQRIERFQQIKDSLDKQAGKPSKQEAPQSAPQAKTKGCKQGGVRAGSTREQGDDTASEGKSKRKRNSKKEAPARTKVKGKPGKRQREALKAAAAAAATGTSGGSADP